MTSHSRGRALAPLLSLQVRSLLCGLGARRDSGRLRVLGACALVALLAAIALAYLWALGSGMVAAGAAGAIPALAALAGSLAAVALVFVKAPGTVFGCRDYDLVAALPVSVRTVVVARTAPLYGFGVVLSALLSAPLYAAYFTSAPASPAAVAAAVAVSVLAPLAPAAAATLVSLALTSVAVRFRHAGAVQLVLSALLVAGVVAGSVALGRASSGVDDVAALAAMGDAAGALSVAASSVYPPAAWAAAAVREGSAAGLLAFAALSLALPALVTLALAACYPSANAVVTSGPRRRARSVATSRAAASPLRALTVKELRRIGSMPFYALNDCAGLILMVVAAGAIALFGVDALLASGVINGAQLDVRTVAAMRAQVDAALPWVFGFCGAMSLTAGPSVSLEARASWLMLTAPVGAGTVLGSKLLANLVLGGVAAAISAAALLAGGTSPLLVLQCVVAAVGMLTGFASLSLAIDASRPNLSWTSPSEVVKRGMPVMVGSIGGVLASFGLAFLSVTAAGAFGPAASAAVNLAAPAVCALAGLATLRAVARRGLPGPGWGE
ncbi:MAG TPA: hypothetical protein IAA42_01700 [Candidatus Olsenella excrementavium]|uniref:Uncharacterized protein n=1 Tax=Candidatus Olsenella excrementavium TaxID=2838709 RepID=A0A9D2CFS0_9ACTN|nr:hypothetical protein [Candidatus Olsenella excrementavium]